MEGVENRENLCPGGGWRRGSRAGEKEPLRGLSAMDGPCLLGKSTEAAGSMAWRLRESLSPCHCGLGRSFSGRMGMSGGWVSRAHVGSWFMQQDAQGQMACLSSTQLYP